MRVAILGGGAIGLACAWRLLQRGAHLGLHVDVYDRGAIGGGASSASAGLLAATAGHGGPAGSPLDALCRRGLDRWPSFAREVEAASGIDVALRTEGTLVVALGTDEAERLYVAFEAWRAAGDSAQRWLSARDVAALEPALAERVVAARFCPDDGQVDARALIAALGTAVRRASGIVHEHVDVAIDALDADVVIVATGAWSGRLDGMPSLAVRPVKGEMIALRDRATGPWLRHVVFAPGAYLAPRREGRLLVGATVEEAGFDTTITAAALTQLRAAAAAAIPALDDAPLDAQWAGLRPMTPDGAPLLGRLDDRVIVAAGHGRNGILLTPITADVVTSLVLGQPIDAIDSLEPFAPERFGQP